MSRRNTRAAVFFISFLILFFARTWSFDAGPHFDLTCDALAAEGFGPVAVKVCQISNWMPDIYENATSDPYSGHAEWYMELFSGAYGAREHWPESVIDAANRLHFDSSTKFTVNGEEKKLDSPETLAMEWDRLARATRDAVQNYVGVGDVERFLVALGLSLHVAQDFYAHTNWVEPSGVIGFEGPDWKERGEFGSHPTWFDVPTDVRNTEKIYAGVTSRGHGHWKSDGNNNLMSAVNKDWPGRPLYLDASITAYFASRQWIRAVRGWVDDEAFWKRAQNYSNTHGGDLAKDWFGLHSIGFYLGAWQGQGGPSGSDHAGPGGSFDDLTATIIVWHRSGKSFYRSLFEQVVTQIAKKNPDPEGAVSSIPQTYQLQSETKFVTLKVNSVMDLTEALEIGIDPGPDEADFYAAADIAGQDFVSGFLHGYDVFNFTKPNHPFTFVKAISTNRSIDEPVMSLSIRINTSTSTYAGTDDDVYFRINDRTRFELDKPLYNDFETGDSDLYVIKPSDDLKVKDIEYIQIEKSSDGVAGGWMLSSIQVFVNERVLYEGQVSKWLEENHRTWRAPDFQRQMPKTPEVPVRLALYDDDGGLYGDDDHCDINPRAGLYDLYMLYNTPGKNVRGDVHGAGQFNVVGGSKYGGRDDDEDKCGIGFIIDTQTVVPPPRMSEDDYINSWKFGRETERELEIDVQYRLSNAHGNQNVFLGAEVLNGGLIQDFFSVTSPTVRPGWGTATVRLRYRRAQEAPPSLQTDQIKLFFYVRNKGRFGVKNATRQKTWTSRPTGSSPPKAAPVDKILNWNITRQTGTVLIMDVEYQLTSSHGDKNVFLGAQILKDNKIQDFFVMNPPPVRRGTGRATLRIRYKTGAADAPNRLQTDTIKLFFFIPEEGRFGELEAPSQKVWIK